MVGPWTLWCYRKSFPYSCYCIRRPPVKRNKQPLFLSPKSKKDQPLKKDNHFKTLSSEAMGSKHK